MSFLFTLICILLLKDFVRDQCGIYFLMELCNSPKWRWKNQPSYWHTLQFSLRPLSWFSNENAELQNWSIFYCVSNMILISHYIRVHSGLSIQFMIQSFVQKRIVEKSSYSRSIHSFQCFAVSIQSSFMKGIWVFQQ